MKVDDGTLKSGFSRATTMKTDDGPPRANTMKADEGPPKSGLGLPRGLTMKVQG